MAMDFKKIGLIVGAVICLLLFIATFVFIFFFPSWFGTGQEGEGIMPSIPEVGLRIALVFGIFITGIVILAGIALVIWEHFFKKKELHIVKEHQAILKDATMLNPSETLGRLVMTGLGKIQHYPLGKIIGHTQVPVKFERHVLYDENGNESPLSETEQDYQARKEEAIAQGKDKYDFFAFVKKAGFYALPIFSLFEPVKIFACYPSERSPDLIGDIEIYDVGTWKHLGIFVPAQRTKEPMITVQEIKNQLMPIAYTNMLDYIGLVAQRGVEGDTSLQKWLETKASLVNVKE